MCVCVCVLLAVQGKGSYTSNEGLIHTHSRGNRSYCRIVELEGMGWILHADNSEVIR